MKHFALILLFAVFAPTAAFALSSQSGDQVQGSFSSLADPDDQNPVGLPSGDRANAFEGDPLGQGFINLDRVNQSKARGNGSYLPPDTETPQK